MQKKAAYVCLCAKKFSHVCAVVQKKLCMWLHACEKKFARGSMHANFFCMCLHACKKNFARVEPHAKKVCMHADTCKKSLHACIYVRTFLLVGACMPTFLRVGAYMQTFFACGRMHAKFSCTHANWCVIFQHDVACVRIFLACMRTTSCMWLTTCEKFLACMQLLAD